VQGCIAAIRHILARQKNVFKWEVLRSNINNVSKY
jgi:hypothetical protein